MILILTVRKLVHRGKTRVTVSKQVLVNGRVIRNLALINALIRLISSAWKIRIASGFPIDKGAQRVVPA
jgi:hypothetical protein